jgi:hypothetical protein
MELFGQNVNQSNMKINQFISENGIQLLIKDTVEEYNAGWMVVDMKDIGKMIGLI